MKTRKILALLLIVLMVVPMTALAEGELSAPGELPIWKGAEPYKLTILVEPNDYVTDYENNDFTHWIEESCNVDLVFEYLPKADAGDKLAIMVQSGDKLPDIVCFGLNNATAYAYGENGAFLNLRDYYDRALAVNMDDAMARFPELNLLGSITNYDGSVYAVPRFQDSRDNETKYKMWINKSFLDNLGMEMPKTTEEFKQMLIRFRDEDANGNGDPSDEMPLLGCTSWGGDITKFLTNAFVFEGDDDMWMLKDGKVTASYLQDAWFVACDYLQDLCAEGLLLPQSFTYERNDIAAVGKTQNVVGAITASQIYFMQNKEEGAVDLAFNYWSLDPLTGPDGYCCVAYAASTATPQWFVTADCSNPELAFRVGDFIFCEEGFMRGYWGLEGQNYLSVEDFKAEYPGVLIGEPKPETGLTALYVVNSPDGKYQQAFQHVGNVHWYSQMPYFSGLASVQVVGPTTDLEGNDIASAEVNLVTRQHDASDIAQTKKPGADTYCPDLSFSSDELEEISEIRANLRSFVNEQRTLYIMGDKGSKLYDREAFLNELKVIGIDRVLDLANIAYERQYK